MSFKPLLCPQRVRQVPERFSWVDQRLVRERHIGHCSHAGAALYLFLLTVSDAKGMSYYGDTSIMQRLGMDAPTLHAARENLLQADLVAWQPPFYQVLSLDVPGSDTKAGKRSSTTRSVAQIIAQLQEDR